MMSAETLIKAQKLCVQSGRRFLLNTINWEVKRGEHWLVFGLNGSGKTTLLSAVCGFKPPTSGHLEVFGQTYSNANILSLRQKIGWVSNSFFDKYFSHESALQIVLSGLTGTLGLDFSLTDAQVRQTKALLGELRMQDKMNTPFDLLSKGERQNILIARALIARPDILVLDEPGTGLDVYAREHLLSTVRELAAAGQVTIIYVTHYPEEIQPFLNKTLLLRGGRVFASGDTAQIITSENISRLMNEDVTVTREPSGHIHMTLQAPSALCALCYPPKEVSCHA